MTTEGSEPEHYAVLELRRLRAALNETVNELIGRWSASGRSGDWPAAAEELQLAMFTLADRTAPAGRPPKDLAIATSRNPLHSAQPTQPSGPGRCRMCGARCIWEGKTYTKVHWSGCPLRKDRK